MLGFLGEPPGFILIHYALGRIIAIIVAVVVGIVMAVLVFPNSATDLVRSRGSLPPMQDWHE